MGLKKMIEPARELSGVIRVPGDKSISHRAALLGAIAEGTTEIEGFLASDDCLHTLGCLHALGVSVHCKEGQELAWEWDNGAEARTISGKGGGEGVGSAFEEILKRGSETAVGAVFEKVFIEGKGLRGLHEPEGVLDAGNSGTTMRLLSGLLAGQPFTSILTGDASLCQRPMGRVTVPLREMGARICGRQGGTLAPLAITGGNLRPIKHEMPVASAQVKSALLLAGLYAPGQTSICEPTVSRNHTELMLRAFGAEINTERIGKGGLVAVKGLPSLQAQRVVIPGDLSSAAFFMVAALIVPDGKLVIESVGLNPTRDGIIEALQAMGAKVGISKRRLVAGEPIGTITVESSSLRGISLGGAMIPRLIDEIPVLAVAALFAEGVTEIRDAAELKVKESNRLTAICQSLVRMGGKVEELSDGLRIRGGHLLQGASCRSFSDHRIAMALAVAALGARGETTVEEAECVDISFPGFWEMLREVRRAEVRSEK